MLKYIKGHMETMANVELFPIISFVIFFLFFFGVIAYAFLVKKTLVDKMSGLPLEDDATLPIENA